VIADTVGGGGASDGRRFPEALHASVAGWVQRAVRHETVHSSSEQQRPVNDIDDESVAVVASWEKRKGLKMAFPNPEPIASGSQLRFSWLFALLIYSQAFTRAPFLILIQHHRSFANQRVWKITSQAPLEGPQASAFPD